MLVPKHKRVHGSRGDAIIEGALIILILANVLIGIFDLGNVLFIRQTFVYRTRSAARPVCAHLRAITAVCYGGRGANHG